MSKLEVLLLLQEALAGAVLNSKLIEILLS